MRVFLQEFSSGGGMIQSDVGASLLVEGFGILRVLVQNCIRLGLDVVVTLDNRLEAIKKFIEADKIEMISKNDDYIENSLDLLDDCDYFLVVAPGIDRILSSIINTYQESAAASLNCESSTVELSTYKNNMYEKFAKTDIKVPETIMLKSENSMKEISNKKIKDEILSVDELFELELEYPLIVKPNDSVDCEGVSLCNNRNELKKYTKEYHWRDLLIQDFIVGDNLSISAYINENHIQILSVNKQLLNLGFKKSEYLGSVSNIKHPLDNEIRRFGEIVLNEIEGLNGFVGIDFIVSRNGKNFGDIYLIEINPRATTSLCGLLNQSNPPVNIIKSKTDCEKFNTCYFSKSKIAISSKQQIPFDSLINMDSIITPPLAIDQHNYYTLVRGFGNNYKTAIADYNKNIAFLSNKLKKEGTSNTDEV